MVDDSRNAPDRGPILMLVAVCGVLLAVAIALNVYAGTTVPSPVLALGEVSDAELVEIRNAAGVTVLSGEFRSTTDALGNIEKDAALMNGRGRTVVGEVEIEIPAPGRENRRPELEVDIISLAPREVFTIFIDDRAVGSFTTDDRGSIDMELQEGEAPGAPEAAGAVQ